MSRLNIQQFYEQNGIIFKSTTNKNINGLCIFHEDKQPTFSVNIETGCFICFSASCNASKGGSVFDFQSLIDNCDFKSSFNKLAELTNVTIPRSNIENIEYVSIDNPKAKKVNNIKEPKVDNNIIDKKIAKEYHANLFNQEYKEALDFLLNERGLTEESIKKYRIGYSINDKRISIPIYDENKKLRNIRLYKPHPKDKIAKFLSFSIGNKKFGEVRLYNHKILQDINEVFFCEGELDCIILNQFGFNSVTATGGAGTFKSDWIKYFKDKRVNLIFDNDDAGKFGAEKIADVLFENNIEAYILNWKNYVNEKGDVTDYFIKEKKTKEDFINEIYNHAIKYDKKEKENKENVEERLIQLSLQQAAEAKYVDKLVELNVLVTGKDTTPYVIPKKVQLTCPIDRGNLCLTCGLSLYGGNKEVIFDSKDKSLLSFIGTSEQQIRTEIKNKFGIVKCPVFSMQIKEKQNIEELRVINELDFENTNDEEYVQRTVFYLGQGLRSNRSYKVSGYPHADPKTQYSTILINNAKPAHDNISSFELKNEIKDGLKIFQANKRSWKDVKTKFLDIYNIFEHSVHDIYNRFEMQVSMDLCWHSILSCNFLGKPVKKAWVECLIMGDSGQGKSKMTESLVKHYGLGFKVSGEQVSMAGLVGGIQQNSGRFFLTWGAMPLNDKRWLYIEELSGMPIEEISKISDIRSSGVAEITKIRTEKTMARVRLQLNSNARRGQISSYNYGVEAVKELFGRPEDVRRLDFAALFASGEVDQNLLNKRYENGSENPYTSNLCKNLILWSWSRKPNQIEITREAEDLILHISKEMSNKYSAKIPLVEPADQRIKIMRLSAATAARVFSCDETGEKVIVDIGHVGFVNNFLNTIYDKKSMGYNEYSKLADKGEKIEEKDKDELILKIKQLPDWERLCKFLKSVRVFRQTGIMEAMGWDKEITKGVFQNLVSKWECLTSTPNGYYKNPFFTQLLKEISDDFDGKDIKFKNDDELF